LKNEVKSLKNILKEAQEKNLELEKQKVWSVFITINTKLFFNL